jgi:hypothetical protein
VRPVDGHRVLSRCCLPLSGVNERGSHRPGSDLARWSGRILDLKGGCRRSGIELDAARDHSGEDSFRKQILTPEAVEVTSSARRFLAVDIRVWFGAHG